MSKYFKQFLGITLTLTLIFHGLVLSYFAVDENPNNDDGIAFFSDSFLEELPIETPMIFGSDDLVIITSKASIGDGLHDIINAVNSFHFEIYVNSIIKTSQKINLVFDIKTLKFPTHYFW